MNIPYKFSDTGAESRKAWLPNSGPADLDDGWEGSQESATPFKESQRVRWLSELPRALAELVRAQIEKANSFVTDQIKWLLRDLWDGRKTREQVLPILCQVSMVWACDIFVAILQAWCEVGIPPEEFDTIVSDEVDYLVTRAAERVKVYMESSYFTRSYVKVLIREALPLVASPYRDQNRSQFVTQETSSESDIAKVTPGVCGVGEGLRGAEASGNRVSAEPEFPKRALSVKEELRKRFWDKNDVMRMGGPDRKTVQKILDGRSVRPEVLEKLVRALSKKGAVSGIPND